MCQCLINVICCACQLDVSMFGEMLFVVHVS